MEASSSWNPFQWSSPLLFSLEVRNPRSCWSERMIKLLGDNWKRCLCWIQETTCAQHTLTEANRSSAVFFHSFFHSKVQRCSSKCLLKLMVKQFSFPLISRGSWVYPCFRKSDNGFLGRVLSSFGNHSCLPCVCFHLGILLVGSAGAMRSGMICARQTAVIVTEKRLISFHRSTLCLLLILTKRALHNKVLTWDPGSLACCFILNLSAIIY